MVSPYPCFEQSAPDRLLSIWPQFFSKTTLCTCFLKFGTFRRRSCSFHDVKWPVLQLCGRCEYVMTNVQFCLLISEALVPILMPGLIKEHFASVMTLINWEMIAVTFSDDTGSRCRRGRVGLSSLLIYNAYCYSPFGQMQTYVNR